MVGERDEHIHYRLMYLGHSHRTAVLLMYGWAMLLAVGLVIAGTISWGRFVLAFAAAGGTVLLAHARSAAPGQGRHRPREGAGQRVETL